MTQWYEAIGVFSMLGNGGVVEFDEPCGHHHKTAEAAYRCGRKEETWDIGASGTPACFVGVRRNDGDMILVADEAERRLIVVSDVLFDLEAPGAVPCLEPASAEEIGAARQKVEAAKHALKRAEDFEYRVLRHCEMEPR